MRATRCGRFRCASLAKPMTCKRFCQRSCRTRDAVVAAKADGDPYRLVDIYEEQVRFLETVNSKPIPADPYAQVVLPREVFWHCGNEIGNVLDVKGVSTR